MPTTDRHRNSDTNNHATGNDNSPPKRNPNLLSVFLKFIIMFLIFSLFLIFLGLTAILLLNLPLAGAFLNRRRHHHHQQTTDLQNHLPTFQYSASTTSDDCSICLECFKEGEACRALPVCDHFFHAECVDSWLTEVLNCPVCRTPVRLDFDRPSDFVVSNDDSNFLWAIGVGRQVAVES